MPLRRGALVLSLIAALLTASARGGRRTRPAPVLFPAARAC